MASPGTFNKPLVLLRRLSKTELDRYGCTMLAKENMRSDDDDDDDDDDVDDDGDLPPVPFASKMASTLNDSDAELKAQGDAILRLYEEKLRSDKANERLQAVENDLARMALEAEAEKAMREDEEEGGDIPQRAVLIEHDLTLSHLPVTNLAVFPDVHPGLDIFSFRPTLFTADMVNFSNLKNPKSGFEKMLQRATYCDLEDYVTMDTFTLRFRLISDKCSAIRFLVRFLSTAKTFYATKSCVDSMKELFTTEPQLARFVTLELIVEVLLNYGTTLAKLLPVELVNPIKLRLAASSNDGEISGGPVDPQRVQPYTVSAVGNYLGSLCKVIILSFEQSVVSRDPDDVFALAIMLVAATLDKKLAESEHLIDVQLSIDRLLNTFSEEQWSQRIGPYVEALCKLSLGHHNMVFLMWSFPLSDRGRHLQRVAASMMLRKVLFVQSIPDTRQLSPSRLLQLVQLAEIHQIDDFYLLHSILHLIDFIVGTDLPISKLKCIPALSDYLVHVTSRIKDKMSTSISGMKVKDIVSQLRNKWSSMVNNTPLVQRTLFSYMNTNENSEANSQASEVTIMESQESM